MYGGPTILLILFLFRVRQRQTGWGTGATDSALVTGHVKVLGPATNKQLIATVSRTYHQHPGVTSGPRLSGLWAREATRNFMWYFESVYRSLRRLPL